MRAHWGSGQPDEAGEVYRRSQARFEAERNLANKPPPAFGVAVSEWAADVLGYFVRDPNGPVKRGVILNPRHEVDTALDYCWMFLLTDEVEHPTPDAVLGRLTTSMVEITGDRRESRTLVPPTDLKRDGEVRRMLKNADFHEVDIPGLGAVRMIRTANIP